MKKVLRLTALALVAVTLMLCLVGCSSKYNSLKKAFEEEGYTENEKLDEISEEIKAELEKDELEVEIHLLSKTLSSAIIVEFNSTDDLVKAFKENEDLRDAVEDIKDNEDVQKIYEELEEAGVVCGNCFIIPISLNPKEITDIVKSAQ